MARSPRPLISDGLYHVTTRGNERQDVFRQDADRRRFLAGLDGQVDVLGWVVGSYCLMPNHVHLVLRTPKPNLSDGLRELLGSYARWFNERHDRVGHLFGDRFHSRLVTRDAHHLELYRYLALNPVRAGICRDPAAFRWSAHGALVGRAQPPRFLSLDLEPFGGERERYARFVAEGSPVGTYLQALVGDGGVERVRAAADAGFSQTQIAHALGIDRNTVGRRLRVQQ